jgi:hypothetical protein
MFAITKQVEIFMLQQVRDMYPPGKQPSVRWLSKRAKATNTLCNGGRRVFVLGDRVPFLIEGKQWPSGEPIKSRFEKGTARSMRGSVLKNAETKQWKPPTIKRPSGYLPPSNFKRPPGDWYQRVLPECPPNLAAYIIFNRVHGRRTSEACKIKPTDIDADWRVYVYDPKGKQHIRFKLADSVIEALNRYPWRLNKYVFGFSDKVLLYRALKAACARAGVPYHVPKDTRAPCHGIRAPGRWTELEGG